MLLVSTVRTNGITDAILKPMNAIGSMTFEGAAIAGSAIIMQKVGAEVALAPRKVRLMHWAIVVIYSLIAVTVFRFALLFCLKHKVFLEAFSQPNAVGIGPTAMQALAKRTAASRPGSDRRSWTRSLSLGRQAAFAL